MGFFDLTPLAAETWNTRPGPARNLRHPHAWAGRGVPDFSKKGEGPPFRFGGATPGEDCKDPRGETYLAHNSPGMSSFLTFDLWPLTFDLWPLTFNLWPSSVLSKSSVQTSHGFSNIFYFQFNFFYYLHNWTFNSGSEDLQN